jgi:hypothetical protein
MVKYILEKYDEVVWTGLIWIRIRISEHGMEPSDSIKA